MIKKFKLTGDCKVIKGLVYVYRIMALYDFSNVVKGEIGGYVESVYMEKLL